MDVLRAKFNSYRRPAFQTATLLVEDGGTKRVVKKPLSIAAIPHVLGLADKCERLQKYHAGFRVLSPLLEAGAGVFEFDPNDSLESRLASKMAAGDKDGFLGDLGDFAAAVVPYRGIEAEADDTARPSAASAAEP